MKKVILFVSCIAIVTLNSFAQDKGIKFQTGLSWKQVLRKAAKENKHVMVDCYASWCVPCKQLEKNVFPEEKVGTEINSRFISIRVQMDSSKSDNEEIKSWYAQARVFEKEYQVQAYPTILFFNSKGEALHKFVGGPPNPEYFLGQVRYVDNENTQCYTLVNHYREHLQDSAFLIHAINAAVKIDDKVYKTDICDAYLNLKKGPLTKSDYQLIMNANPSPTSKAFQIFIKNAGQVDTMFNATTADDFAQGSIAAYEVFPLFKDNSTVNWIQVETTLQQKYPRYAEDVVIKTKRYYYYDRKMWNELSRTHIDYLNRFGAHMNNADINEFIWTIFAVCTDSSTLNDAVRWGAHVLLRKDGLDDYNIVDTYASLLYKAGRRDEAIIWESKAADMAQSKKQENDAKNYYTTIQKMKNGEKIWETFLKDYEN